MFQIGEFSRIARVSPRQLRHYDELGLLKPVHIDPETGYRYCEVEPGVLRSLDLDEESPLPVEFAKGTKSYKEFKEEPEYASAVAGS